MKITIAAVLVLAAAAFAPAATAQMAAGSMAAMSAADTKMIGKCKAMTHDAMMKSTKCMKMMKLHPDQFANTAGSNN
jgi:hypothetical protein